MSGIVEALFVAGLVLPVAAVVAGVLLQAWPGGRKSAPKREAAAAATRAGA